MSCSISRYLNSYQIHYTQSGNASVYLLALDLPAPGLLLFFFDPAAPFFAVLAAFLLVDAAAFFTYQKK